jgi:hypothetical protein
MDFTEGEFDLKISGIEWLYNLESICILALLRSKNGLKTMG